MYSYKYIKMKGIFRKKPEIDVHSVINTYAKDGWRLVQILTPPISLCGRPLYCELIFERKSDSNSEIM